MQIIRVIEEFARGYGLEAPAAEPDGSYVLLLDGRARLVLDPRPASGALYLRIPLDLPDLTDAARAALYRSLLEANLPGAATLGTVFSLDEEDQRIEIQRRVPLAREIELAELAQIIADLYGAAAHVARQAGFRFGGESTSHSIGA
jgi:hypothetical protein